MRLMLFSTVRLVSESFSAISLLLHFCKVRLHVNPSGKDRIHGVFKLPLVALFCDVSHGTRFNCGVHKNRGFAFGIYDDFCFGVELAAFFYHGDVSSGLTLRAEFGDEDFWDGTFSRLVLSHIIEKILNCA